MTNIPANPSFLLSSNRSPCEKQKEYQIIARIVQFLMREPCVKPITKELIPNKTLLVSMMKLLGPQYAIAGGRLIYRHFQEYCADFKWPDLTFYALSNGGFYAAPKSKIASCQYNVPSNYFQGELTADAAGIVTTLFALSTLHGKFEEDNFAIFNMKLLSFAEQHTERKQIFLAID